MRIFWVMVFLISLTFSSLAEQITGNWKFPSDIAVSNGKLYVVDGLNNRVSVYSVASGKHEFDVTLDSPFGIYADGRFVYVVSQKGKLYVLDDNGNVEEELEISGRPIDVVKVGDKLFITNGKLQTLDVYDLNGSLLKRLGGKGTAPGNFVGVFLESASENIVFVVDSVNARIQEFDKNGNFVRTFGTFGVEKGNLFRPKGVAYCGKGRLVVSDGITGAVQIFNVYGGFEKVLKGNLQYPTSVACYGGKVFVLEPLKNRILILKLGE